MIRTLLTTTALAAVLATGALAQDYPRRAVEMVVPFGAGGASKGDIGRVFNAETLIVGFVAGVLGIPITLLLTIPANAIVYARFGVENVAILPWQPAIVLIGISMVLSFVAGLIPSSAASRKDPVEALRSE